MIYLSKKQKQILETTICIPANVFLQKSDENIDTEDLLKQLTSLTKKSEWFINKIVDSHVDIVDLNIDRFFDKNQVKIGLNNGQIYTELNGSEIQGDSKAVFLIYITYAAKVNEFINKNVQDDKMISVFADTISRFTMNRLSSMTQVGDSIIIKSEKINPLSIILACFVVDLVIEPKITKETIQLLLLLAILANIDEKSVAGFVPLCKVVIQKIGDYFKLNVEDLVKIMQQK
jgi:hypothetical protein